MNKYGIIRTVEGGGVLVARIKERIVPVSEIEGEWSTYSYDESDVYCRISKVILNTSPKLETDKSRKRWRSKYNCRWQKDAYIKKEDIFEFEDDETAMLAMEVM